MKRTGIFVLIMLFFSIGLICQNEKEKVKVYKVWVTKIDGSVIKGFLHSAEVDSVFVNTMKDLSSSNLKVVEPKQISKIEVRRKGKVLKAAGVGFAVGAIAGVALSSEESIISSDAVTAISASGLGLIGAGLGALVTSGKEEILLYGSLEIYNEQLKLLQEYSYKVEH
ncbi:MAG: hypothetical protein HKO61_03955 [Flavobacteriaceae bacterium]|nr:hypothetical protein [Bacteroidia bacterium]NNE03577.1 hypothetical protein [Eudoraea sp.]NNM08298.1 hypothetical protein [Flavobacteriaceae bacterium]